MPFSAAIIRGAESVKAIKPNLAVVVSTLGASATGLTLAAALVLVVEVLSLAVLLRQPWSKTELAAAAPVVKMNCRLLNFVILDW
jgi:hypothetical protein